MPMPAPVTWTDGEEPFNIPSADDLNRDWKDSFDFLLGTTRPMGFFRGTTGQAITTTFANMNLQDEVLKRYITHSVVSNTHLAVVQYSGQYQGYVQATFESISAVNLRCIIRVMRGGSVEVARVNGTNAQTGNWTINGSFTANLTAGDTLSMQMAMASGTATSGSIVSRVPRLVFWYAGDY